MCRWKEEAIRPQKPVFFSNDNIYQVPQSRRLGELPVSKTVLFDNKEKAITMCSTYCKLNKDDHLFNPHVT